MAILAVNAGSSSLKFGVHPCGGGAALLKGQVEGLQPGGAPRLSWEVDGRSFRHDLAADAGDPFDAALDALRGVLADEPTVPALQAVAHRVVHGGSEFRQPVIADERVLERLALLNSLAPLHQPHNLQGIRAFRRAFPSLPQVACFDTAFHATIEPLDYSFALPSHLAGQGVRRYGFHGLSYRYISTVLGALSEPARGRLLMAHLGNGASLCAARGGRSCATTMGFSALDGLMMGTRSGSIDAGVLLYLMEQGWNHDRLQQLLYRESGLLGVSGLSADMRQLRADGGERARFAIDLFTRTVVREAGAMIACLGGLDAVAFSAGIGEHDAQLRADVVASLGWVGARLDERSNAAACDGQVRRISAVGSAVEIWVVPTDEGRMAAQEAAVLLGAAAQSAR